MSSSTSSTSPMAPSTPVRPQRSTARLSLATSSSTLPSFTEDPLSTPPMPSASSTPSTSSTLDAQSPKTPNTPALPPRTQHNHCKSTTSIRRKPVPLSLADEVELEMANAQPRTAEEVHMQLDNPFVDPSSVPTYSFPSSTTRQHTITSSPPRYFLQVDQPPPFPDAGFDQPPRTANAYQFHAGIGSSITLHEDLPRYAEQTQTEPKTLARGLWKWGFLCPFLWFIGMCIMWIPLRPLEEEQDAEKEQKLEEMIVILRKTELKYARRCAIAFGIFVGVLAAVICIAVGVTYAIRHH